MTAAAHPFPRADPLDRARRHIERRLDTPLSLSELAEAAALSPYHFARLFAARYGLSPMAYVRVRRLEGAAERLRAGDAVGLIDLALDCGFDSQEGFTRAFARLFGVSPGRYRDGARPTPTVSSFMSDRDLPLANLTGGVAPARKPALRLAGLGGDFDEATMAQIPAVWDRLVPHLPLPGQSGGVTYGVCGPGPGGKGLHYVAAVELAPDALAPDGFELVELPPLSFLVFRQVLSGGPLHPQMQAAVREIWAERVPKSGCTLARAPELEVYPDDFRPNRPGAWVEWWIPVDV